MARGRTECAGPPIRLARRRGLTPYLLTRYFGLRSFSTLYGMLPGPTRFCWSCWRAVRLYPPCCISVCRAIPRSSTAQHSALRRRNRLRHQRQTHLTALVGHASACQRPLAGASLIRLRSWVRRGCLEALAQYCSLRWDRPSAFVVCHPSQKGGWLTDDKRRSSVPPGVSLSEQY
jgi:hypothetical protein